VTIAVALPVKINLLSLITVQNSFPFSTKNKKALVFERFAARNPLLPDVEKQGLSLALCQRPTAAFAPVTVTQTYSVRPRKHAALKNGILSAAFSFTGRFLRMCAIQFARLRGTPQPLQGHGIMIRYTGQNVKYRHVFLRKGYFPGIPARLV